MHETVSSTSLTKNNLLNVLVLEMSDHLKDDRVLFSSYSHQVLLKDPTFLQVLILSDFVIYSPGQYEVSIQTHQCLV
jgi:hypothetical protein